MDLPTPSNTDYQLNNVMTRTRTASDEFLKKRKIHEKGEHSLSLFFKPAEANTSIQPQRTIHGPQ